MVASPTLPTPPRLTGEMETDMAAFVQWAALQYQKLVPEGQVLNALARLRTITPLDQTITNPPTQAEVKAVQDKLNAILAAIAIQ